MEIFRLRRWKAVVRQFGRGRARRFGGSYAGAAAPGMIVPGAVVPGRALGRGGISGAIFFGPDFRGRTLGAAPFRSGISGSDIQDRAYEAQGVLRRNPRAEVSRFRRSGMVRQAARK